MHNSYTVVSIDGQNETRELWTQKSITSRNDYKRLLLFCILSWTLIAINDWEKKKNKQKSRDAKNDILADDMEHFVKMTRSKLEIEFQLINEMKVYNKHLIKYLFQPKPNNRGGPYVL